MKIGIFGGSFNPPHKGHEAIATKLLEQNIVDKIVIVPTGIKYEYKTNLLPNEIRKTLLEFLIKKNPNISINTYEYQEKPIHTYETLDYFQEQYPNDEIYFICGVDNLSYIHKWPKSEYLLKNYKLIVIPRKDNHSEQIIGKYKNHPNIIFMNWDLLPISSTEIREKIKNKQYQDLKDKIDQEELVWIEKNHLYEDII